jgi:hypothetical protein
MYTHVQRDLRGGTAALVRFSAGTYLRLALPLAGLAVAVAFVSWAAWPVRWFAPVLVGYAATLMVALMLSVVRRRDQRYAAWCIDAGWITSGFVAFVFAMRFTTLPESLLLPGAGILLMAYCAHAFRFIHSSPVRGRMLAGALAFGYIALAAVNVYQDVRGQGGASDQMGTLAITAGDGVFLIAAWAYGLAALSMQHVPMHFRDARCYPSWALRVESLVTKHHPVLQAWVLPLVVLPWVALSWPVDALRAQLIPATHTDLLWFWAFFFLLYVTVLIPTCGLAVALGWRRPNGQEMPTIHRRALLTAMRPAIFLLSFTMFMLAATTFLVAHEAQWPLDRLPGVVGRWVPSANVVAEDAKLAAARLNANRTALDAGARAASIAGQSADGVLDEEVAAARAVAADALTGWRTWETGPAEQAEANRRAAEEATRAAVAAWNDVARVARARQSLLPVERAQFATWLGETASATAAAGDAWVAYAEQMTVRSSAAARAQIAALILFVFCAIVLQFLLLVEFPYYWGQRRWRALLVAKAEQRLHASEQLLQSTLQPGAAVDAAVWDEHKAAQDQLRAAEETPKHTFKSAADLTRKLLQTATGVALAALVGPPGKEVAKAVFGG